MDLLHNITDRFERWLPCDLEIKAGMRVWQEAVDLCDIDANTAGSF